MTFETEILLFVGSAIATVYVGSLLALFTDELLDDWKTNRMFKQFEREMEKIEKQAKPKKTTKAKEKTDGAKSGK